MDDIAFHPIIRPSLFPPKKPKEAKKEHPPITLLGYSWVYNEVRSYSTSFLTYESITNFLEEVKFRLIDGPNVMIIDSCLKSEHIFMCSYSAKTHFMYMYSSLFSNLHLIIPFGKFEINVL